MIYDHLLSANTCGFQQIASQDEIGLDMCTGIPLHTFFSFITKEVRNEIYKQGALSFNFIIRRVQPGAE